MTISKQDFPANFIFGVATSSYQIEGATREDGRGDSIWDTFCREQGRVSDGTSGDVACDHYHLWESDLDLIKAMGVDAYRFSVAWPRVQPDGKGAINPKGLDFYERLVDGMLERGLKPYLTLYHWDLPQTLQDDGGWVNRETAYRFAEYARVVAERLGERVASYATLNEPWCSSILSYQIGEHAPGLRDRKLALAAAHHLLLGHGEAVAAMRSVVPASDLGIVLNLQPAYPASQAPEDVAAARFADGTFNRWFMDPIFRAEYPQDIWDAYGADVPQVQDGDLVRIAQPIDFLGVNYYSRSVNGASGNVKPDESSYTHMGWEVYPQGLTDLLVRLNEDYTLPPMFITENGAAYPDELQGEGVHDTERVEYFKAHLGAVAQAVKQGVNMGGYFAWSLMDNFEWAWGYSRRFGLIYVDYDSQRRVWKDSARWYRDLLQPVAVAQ
ncbi:GH1 family beta-glucosidase [Deinococcus peraridilitoris]|uniref:Beta-glucosidase n=1 Tax=Deinococcus peraridilitoris (strain DSM 19664 / LMG 22246 / CIP 109416 / KR-200) TaxID=937777 RepID=L0A0G1_DEIPD|nr:GH1 family beta-glucosidase [Deinococcus peraridilitoris]AFZ66637.1 beta-galactosidase [Deinococcus peraridilitoris DSM 19664]